MGKPWKLLLFIVLLTAGSIYVDWPTLPLHFQIGPIKVDQELKTNKIDLDFFGQPIQRDLEIKQGLDLAGGTQLTLKVDMTRIRDEDRQQALDSATAVIANRVNLYGVSEPQVFSSKVGSEYRINVELPGVKDINEAVNLVGKTAQLEIREIIDVSKIYVNTSQGQGLRIEYSNTKPIGEGGLTGADFKKASVDFQRDSSGRTVTSQPVVRFELTDAGGKKMSEVTKRLVKKDIPLPIFLDQEIISAPVVDSEITTDGVIQGNFTVDSAKTLATQLNAGALPAPISIIQQQTVGATLGEVTIHRAVAAGILGLLVIALFMVLSYGRFGAVATLALLIYALLNLAVFKLIPVTLTLAGIAGFILSVGMAVDANILVFERMKEELRRGKERTVALELGFSWAWTSIRDSNIVTIVTALIIYQYTTGFVKGFALTLFIGVVFSMFTAIVVTRTLLRMFFR